MWYYRRVPRSWFATTLCIVSVCGYGLLIVLFWLDRATDALPEYYGGAWTLLCAGCAASAVLMYLIRSRELLRLVIAAQLFAVVLFQHFLGFLFPYELTLVVLLVCGAAVYQSFPSNLVACGLIVVITTLFRGETLRTVFPDDADLVVNQVFYFLLTGGFGVVLSLVIRYRESVIDHQDQIDELRAIGARLAEANLSVQNYAQNVRESTLSQERKRLTREVHDIVGYLVTNVSMAFEAIRLMATREPESIPELVVHARAQVETGLSEMRDVLRDLRSTPVERVSAVYSIRRLVRTFADATGISIRIEHGNATLFYDDVVQTVIYRFIQEGMINAFRHGSATRIVIQFWQTDAELTVTVWDNGAVPDQIEEGIGIAGMRERLDLVRGTLHIDLVPEGFRISMSIPTGRVAAESGAPIVDGPAPGEEM